MVVTPVIGDDLDWVVKILRGRREALVPHAPVFWRPALDADSPPPHVPRPPPHRGWSEGVAYDVVGARRRPSSRRLARRQHADRGLEPRRGQPSGTPSRPAAAATRCSCVVPAYETARARHAAAAGLTVIESWWLLDPFLGRRRGRSPGAPAAARPSPWLLRRSMPHPVRCCSFPGVTDTMRCRTPSTRRVRSVALVSWSTSAGGDDAIVPALTDRGFRRHCDFFEGVVRPV